MQDLTISNSLKLPAYYALVNQSVPTQYTPYTQYKAYIEDARDVNNKYLSTRRNLVRLLKDGIDQYNLDYYFLRHYINGDYRNNIFSVNNHKFFYSEAAGSRLFSVKNSKYNDISNYDTDVTIDGQSWFNQDMPFPYTETSSAVSLAEKMYYGLYRLNVNELSYQTSYVVEGDDSEDLHFENPPKHFTQSSDARDRFIQGRLLRYSLFDFKGLQEERISNPDSIYRYNNGLTNFGGSSEPIKLFGWDRCWGIGGADWTAPIDNYFSDENTNKIRYNAAYKLRYVNPLTNGVHGRVRIGKLSAFDPKFVPDTIKRESSGKKIPVYYAYPETGELRVLNLKDQKFIPISNNITYNIQQDFIDVYDSNLNRVILIDDVKKTIGYRDMTGEYGRWSPTGYNGRLRLPLEAMWDYQYDKTKCEESVYSKNVDILNHSRNLQPYKVYNVLARNQHVTADLTSSVRQYNRSECNVHLDNRLDVYTYGYLGDYNYPLKRVTSVSLVKNNNKLNEYTERDPHISILRTIYNNEYEDFIYNIRISYPGIDNEPGLPLVNRQPYYTGKIDAYRKNVFNDNANTDKAIHRYLVPFTVNNLGEYTAEDEYPSKLREMINLPKNYEEWDTKHVYVMRARPFWSYPANGSNTDLIQSKHARKLHTFGKAEFIQNTTLRIENVDITFKKGDTFYTDSIYPYHFYGNFIEDRNVIKHVANPRHSLQQYHAYMNGGYGKAFNNNLFNGQFVIDGTLSDTRSYDQIYLMHENGYLTNHNPENKYLDEIMLYDYYPVIPINDGYIENGIVHGDVLMLSKQLAASNRPYWYLIKPGTKLKAIQITKKEGRLYKRTWTADDLVNHANMTSISGNQPITNDELKQSWFYYSGVDIQAENLTKIPVNKSINRLFFKSMFPLRPIVVQEDNTRVIVKYTNALNRIWSDVGNKAYRSIEVLDFFTTTVDVLKWDSTNPPFEFTNQIDLDLDLDVFDKNQRIRLRQNAWLELQIDEAKINGFINRTTDVSFPIKLTELLANLKPNGTVPSSTNIVSSSEVTLHGRRFQVIDGLLKTKVKLLPARTHYVYPYADQLPANARYNKDLGYYYDSDTGTALSERYTMYKRMSLYNGFTTAPNGSLRFYATMFGINPNTELLRRVGGITGSSLSALPINDSYIKVTLRYKDNRVVSKTFDITRYTQFSRNPEPIVVEDFELRYMGYSDGYSNNNPYDDWRTYPIGQDIPIYIIETDENSPNYGQRTAKADVLTYIPSHFNITDIVIEVSTLDETTGERISPWKANVRAVPRNHTFKVYSHNPGKVLGDSKTFRMEIDNIDFEFCRVWDVNHPLFNVDLRETNYLNEDVYIPFGNLRFVSIFYNEQQTLFAEDFLNETGKYYANNIHGLFNKLMRNEERWFSSNKYDTDSPKYPSVYNDVGLVELDETDTIKRALKQVSYKGDVRLVNIAGNKIIVEFKLNGPVTYRGSNRTEFANSWFYREIYRKGRINGPFANDLNNFNKVTTFFEYGFSHQTDEYGRYGEYHLADFFNMLDFKKRSELYLRDKVTYDLVPVSADASLEFHGKGFTILNLQNCTNNLKGFKLGVKMTVNNGNVNAQRIVWIKDTLEENEDIVTSTDNLRLLSSIDGNVSIAIDYDFIKNAFSDNLSVTNYFRRYSVFDWSLSNAPTLTIEPIVTSSSNSNTSDKYISVSALKVLHVN